MLKCYFSDSSLLAAKLGLVVVHSPKHIYRR